MKKVLALALTLAILALCVSSPVQAHSYRTGAYSGFHGGFHGYGFNYASVVVAPQAYYYAQPLVVAPVIAQPVVAAPVVVAPAVVAAPVVSPAYSAPLASAVTIANSYGSGGYAASSYVYSGYGYGYSPVIVRQRVFVTGGFHGHLGGRSSPVVIRRR